MEVWLVLVQETSPPLPPELFSVFTSPSVWELEQTQRDQSEESTD